MKEILTFIGILIFAVIAGVSLSLIISYPGNKITISEEVCLDAGLVVYKYNKCTTEEWASEQINKLVKVKQ